MGNGNNQTDALAWIVALEFLMPKNTQQKLHFFKE